jgi:hypothetical protein
MWDRDWIVSCVGKYVAQGLDCVLRGKICGTGTGLCPVSENMWHWDWIMSCIGKYVAQGLDLCPV